MRRISVTRSRSGAASFRTDPDPFALGLKGAASLAHRTLAAPAISRQYPAVEPIRFFNRHSGRMETEEVYGEAFLRWAYGHPLGPIALSALVTRPAFSRWYGRRMNRPSSKHRIAPFIERYRLDPSEFADPAESFPNFNAFFFRKLKAGCRPVDPDPATAVFPADARHLGFADASQVEGVFVKGQRFDLPALLGDRTLAERFARGTLVLSRLCPVDYHRFHFPVDGQPTEPRILPGPLYSVSPIALRRKLSYLWTNRRCLTVLESASFGTVLLMEIGATCVGSIHQTHPPGKAARKGAEKGFFAFGGSSTLTLFEPGRVTLAEDLLEHSRGGTELYARFGSPMAFLSPSAF
jgi:phosphatidylserine decarboxylase